MMIGRKDAELHPHLPRNPLRDCLPTHIKEGHLWNEHMLKYANACGNPSSSHVPQEKATFAWGRERDGSSDIPQGRFRHVSFSRRLSYQFWNGFIVLQPFCIIRIDLTPKHYHNCTFLSNINLVPAVSLKCVQCTLASHPGCQTDPGPPEECASSNNFCIVISQYTRPGDWIIRWVCLHNLKKKETQKRDEQLFAFCLLTTLNCQVTGTVNKQ